MTGKLEFSQDGDGGFFPRLARAACEGAQGTFDQDAGMHDPRLQQAAVEGFALRHLLGGCVGVVDAPPDPSPPALSGPGTFPTHADADAWLDTYLAETGHDRPDDWDGHTVAEKRSAAQALYEHWEADH